MTDLRELSLDRIRGQDLRDFLAAHPREAINLEYKRDISVSTVETVASMANTYGGTIVVGVTDIDDDPPSTITGVAGTTRDDLVNKCFDSLEPPFAPRMVEVEVDGKRVLVVRIEPGEVDLPVVLNGKVHVRLEGRNAPATRFQIRDMCARQPPDVDPVADGNYLSGRIDLPHPEEGEAVVRALTGLALPSYQTSPTVIEQPLRRQLASALRRSPVTGWLRRRNNVEAGDDWPEWSLHGHASRTAATFSTGAHPADAHATCYLRLPSMTMPGGHAAVAIDVSANPAGTVREGQAPLPLKDLYYLLDALTETLFTSVAEHIARNLAGTSRLRHIGAHVTIRTGDSLLAALGLDRSITIPGARPAPGATLRSDPTSDMTDPDVRRRQILQWLEHGLLDAGVEDPERALQGL